MAPYVNAEIARTYGWRLLLQGPENRPLVGPLPVDGAFVTGALSGFGLMSAHGAGELAGCTSSAERSRLRRLVSRRHGTMIRTIDDASRSGDRWSDNSELRNGGNVACGDGRRLRLTAGWRLAAVRPAVGLFASSYG
jgi:hypothetical protein